MSNSNVQRMSCDMWIQFCDIMGLSGENGKAPLVNHEELEAIFTATNDAAAILAAKAGFKGHRGPAGARPVDMDDASLSRGEFYEALLRVGFLKFEKQMAGGSSASLPEQASDAIDSFLRGLIAQAPEAAVEDPDLFRRSCLYTPAMEKTIKDHWDVLTASYNVFRSTQPRGGGILFELETWESMLTNLDLMPSKVDQATAIQIFQRSQMALTNELTNRARLSEISKWEFAEALARLSDHVKLGGVQEGWAAGGPELATRFDALMEHIVDSMARNFGFYAGDDDDDDDDGDFDLDEEDKPAPYVPRQIPQAVAMPDCLEDEPDPLVAAKPPAAIEREEADEEEREDQEDKEFDELFGDGEKKTDEFEDGAEIDYDDSKQRASDSKF